MCTVLVWARQLFDALDYMYQEHKIVHRDLKPENILVTDEYFLKIGDLGAAKYIDHTFSGSFVGTHRYMSPLQIDESQEISDPSKQSIQHSHKNDVYSLGLVLWEIVERRVVLAGYNERDGYFNRDLFSHDINSKKLKEALLCRCQANVQELIENCTRFARNERPTAYVVLEDLQAILSSDLFISQLTFEPREEEEQRKLLRPIGFNGTEERVFILDHFGINLDPSVDLFAPVMMEIC
ncbi:unnamed protein product, partial [Mesorhabditis belari]|uniref:non-specific serine/threonine protein kinase n=1 Tax=Mesorhabditis belari TaxID=2138241 RepID=A0AAF3EXA5_9BILA